MGINVLTVCYIVAAVSFILGLKMLSNPAMARRGNLIAAGGMTIAILATIFLYEDELGMRLHNYAWIFGGILIGGVIGSLTARRVQMTAMPEMVSLFNGMGGACAALISIVEFGRLLQQPFGGTKGFTLYPPLSALGPNVGSMYLRRGELLIILLGLIIGAVSLAGSLIAWGKLNGKIRDRVFRGQHLVNIFVLALIVAGGIWLMWSFNEHTIMEHLGRKISEAFEGGRTSGSLWVAASRPVPEWFAVLFYCLFGLALIYGILFVLPIGGADMPVVISLLNSFTGVAAACGGFLYNNKAMLTGGILVGAAGTLLTVLMCKAMNRSLVNVLIGAFGGAAANNGGGAVGAGVSKEQGSFKEISLSDTAMVLGYAHKVMIVPGYGLAVAQAQHACHELEKLLTERGVEVKYAIHPVAGRMPGHMNVLLAEADVSYENLLEMERANEELATTDVVIVLGANDVVNPAARTDPASPIYGMPIIEVELAKSCIVNKRSMKPGYAGIENDLFFRPKTSMLFGDAKKVLQELIAELKNL